jgi:hypothetical protein
MELRTKIGRIAAAVGFAVLIGGFAAGPVRADSDDHRGGDRNRGSEQHRDNDNRGYRGGNNYAYQQEPDYYYYNPQPNYYAAPDPYYYGSDRRNDAAPPGVSLFFGL